MARPYRDRLFRNPPEGAFRFDERVAELFEEMAERSIPGYRELLEGIGELARRHLHRRGYDLGCALGAAAMAMAEAAPSGVTVVAVDHSWPMVARLRERLRERPCRHKVLPLCADIRRIDFPGANMVVLNFTLQFLPLQDRLPLLKKIARDLEEEGVLLLSEKVAPEDPRERLWLTYLHARFKEAQGYLQRESYHKRRALEGVLLPEPLERHLERLKEAGFRQIELWFQRFNFVSLLAFK